MTVPRRLRYVGIWLALTGFLLAAAAPNRVGGKETEEPRVNRDDPYSPGYGLPDHQRRGGPAGDELLTSIKSKLAALKPAHGKVADDDFFVVGTIDLENHHATVEYVIKQGLRQTAEFIADFVQGEKPGTVRHWRAFGRAPNPKAAEAIRTKAKAESIEGRLTAFPSSGKKSPDDYFVVGTADMNSRTLHADIRFEVLNGVKVTADFLTDFIYKRTRGHEGEWHVFFRGRTEAQVTAYRQRLRDAYDSLETQRAQLASIYHAKSTARC